MLWCRHHHRCLQRLSRPSSPWCWLRRSNGACWGSRTVTGYLDTKSTFHESPQLTEFQSNLRSLRGSQWEFTKGRWQRISSATPSRPRRSPKGHETRAVHHLGLDGIRVVVAEEES